MHHGVPKHILIRRWAAALVLILALVGLVGVYAPLRSQNAEKIDPVPPALSPAATRRIIRIAPKSASEPKPMAAVLEVHCADASAKVFVNGQGKGKTPVALPFRVMSDALKSVRLSLRAEGFQPYDAPVTLQPGEWKTLDVKLVRLAQQAGKVVCIDPGHPSENEGTTAPDGTTETHVNWVVALKLKALLEKAGLKVVMTKQSEEERVLNRQRAEIANAAGAQLMVRLHCDGVKSKLASGFHLYYPDRSGKKGDDEGPPVHVRQMSRQAATTLHQSLAAGLKGVLRDNGILTDFQSDIGGKQGALTGSIYARVPVVTVEMVFLSNPKDAEFIKTEEGQHQMALALADGIIRFVQSASATVRR